MHYIVVGGGPSGIFTSLLLALCGHQVSLFEKRNVLGGCHRVDRINGFFSEHGPRIYLTNYSYFSQLLAICGINFDESFIDYKFNFIVGIEGALKAMTPWEILQYVLKFILFVFFPNQFENLSVNDVFNGFSDEAMDYINKICTLTDGARSDTYTAHSFFSLFDQNSFYKIVEPKMANDKWMWPVVTQKLSQLGVQVIHEKVHQIVYDSESIVGVRSRSGFHASDSVIVSLPPWHAAPLFTNSGTTIANAFMSRHLWPEYVLSNTYIPYISFTAHFDESIQLPNVWGNGFGEWGVAWIVMSDYFEDGESPTLISALIVDLDTKSERTGLTANETLDPDMLMKEAYYQMNRVINIKDKRPNLILNSAVSYVNGRWTSDDLPYMKTSKSVMVPSHGKIPGLFWVGPHNGNNKYAFTSMESVCENVVAFCASLHPETKCFIKSTPLLTVSFVVKLLSIIMLCIVLYTLG